MGRTVWHACGKQKKCRQNFSWKIAQITWESKV